MATASISVATGGAHSGNQILTFTISSLGSQLKTYTGFYVTTTTVPASNASTTAQISTLESNLICQWLRGDYEAEGWPTSTATSINYLTVDSPSRTKVKDFSPYFGSSVTVRVFAKTSGSTYYFVSNASYTPAYAWAGNDLLKTAASYTTSGSFRSGSTYLSYPVGYTAESPHTYTTAVHASGSGNTAYAEYSFDFSKIPSSATINSVEVRCRGQRYSTTDNTNYKADLELYTGSTLKVSSKFTSTSAQTITIAGGTWTRAQLQNAKLRFTVGYYGGRLYGITWSVKYTSGDGIVRELKDTSVTLNAITRDWNGDSWYSHIGAGTNNSPNYSSGSVPPTNWKYANYLSGQDITVTDLLPDTKYYVWITGRDSNYYRLYNRYLAGTSSPTSSYFYQFTTLKSATATTITGGWKTYTGSNQALVTKSGGTGRTVYYRLGTSGSFSTTIPQASAVGTYTVQWYSTFNSGYSGTDEGSESSPKSVTTYIYTAPAGLSLPYTGSEQKVFTDPNVPAGVVMYQENAPDAGDDWAVWSSTSSDFKLTNVGDVSWKWKITMSTSSPVVLVSGTVTGTITKVDPTYTAPVKKDLTYTGSAQQLVTAGIATGGTMYYRVLQDGSQIVGWTSSVANVVGTAISDNYQIYYYVIGDGNHNNIGSTSQPIGYVTSTISQAVPTYTAPTGKTLTYSGSAQQLITAGTVSGGTLYYRLGTSGTWTTSASSITSTNADTYTIYYYIKGDSTHSDIGSTSSPAGSVTTTIGKASAYTWTTTPQSKVFASGTSQALVTAGTATGGTKYYKLSTASSYSTSIPTASTVGAYTINYYIKGDSNHEDGEVGSVISYIYTAPTAKTNLSYTGSSQTLFNNGSAPSGYTVQYRLASASSSTSWTTTVPSQTNAGTYEYHWRIASGTGSSVTPIVGGATDAYKLSVTIAKLDPTYTPPTGKTVDYSPTMPSQRIADEGTATNGTLYYRLGTSGSWTTSINSMKGENAGSYDVYYYVKGNTNYNDIGSTSSPIGYVTGVINPIDPGYFDGVSVNYNGNAHDLVDPEDINGTPRTIYYRVGTSGSFSTTVPTATNCGSYTIYYYVVSGNSNYTDAGSASNPRSVTSTINQIPAVISRAPSGKTLTYTGSAQQLINAGASTTALWYRVGTSGSWTSITSQVSATDVGTYDIYYYAMADHNHTSAGSESDPYGSVTATIGKADPIYTAPTGKTVTYTGSSQQIANAGSATGGTMYYRLGTGGTWTTSISSMTGTAAGSYTVYYYVKGDTNHNDIGSTSSPIGSITGTIQNATPTYTAPTAKTLTYTGSSQQLVNAGSATGGTVYYRLGTSGTWTTSVSSMTGTAAGDYSVYYYIKGSTNYDDVGSTSSPLGPVTVTISKANPTYTAPTGKTVTYSGSSQQIANSGTATHGTLYYRLGTSGSWTTAITSMVGTNAGSYNVYYYVKGDTNYSDIGSTSSPIGYVTGTIEKLSAGSVAGVTLNYTGSAQTIVVPSVVNGTARYRVGTSGSFSTTQPTRTDVGTYTVQYYITPSDSTNYSAVGSSTSPISITSEIVAIPATYTAPTARDLTYTGIAQILVNAGTVSGGAMYYRVGTSGSWTSSLTTITGAAAGDYQVYYYIAPDSNHTHTSSATNPLGPVTVTIDKADPTYSAPTGKTVTYNGSSQQIANAGSATNGTMYYRLGTSGSWTTSISSMVGTNAGSYSVYYYIKGNTNYNDIGSTSSPLGPVTGTIEKKSAGSVAGVTVDYTGSAQAMAVPSVANGTARYRVGTSGSFSTTIPTRTNVGTYTIQYYITPSDSTNYSAVGTSSSPISVTSSIEAVAPTYTAPSGKTVTYSGSSQQIANSGSVTGGTMYYRLGTDGSWVTTISSMVGTNVGDYNVYYYVAGDSNHTDIGSTTNPIGYVTGTVEKADASYTAPSGLTKHYTGVAQQIVTAGSASGGTMYYRVVDGSGSQVVNWTSTLSSVAATNIDTGYKIYYYVLGDSNHNNIGSTSNPIGYISSKIVSSVGVYTGSSWSRHSGGYYSTTSTYNGDCLVYYFDGTEWKLCGYN